MSQNKSAANKNKLDTLEKVYYNAVSDLQNLQKELHIYSKSDQDMLLTKHETAVRNARQYFENAALENQAALKDEEDRERLELFGTTQRYSAEIPFDYPVEEKKTEKKSGFFDNMKNKMSASIGSIAGSIKDHADLTKSVSHALIGEDPKTLIQRVESKIDNNLDATNVQSQINMDRLAQMEATLSNRISSLESYLKNRVNEAKVQLPEDMGLFRDEDPSIHGGGSPEDVRRGSNKKDVSVNNDVASVINRLAPRDVRDTSGVESKSGGVNLDGVRFTQSTFGTRISDRISGLFGGSSSSSNLHHGPIDNVKVEGQPFKFTSGGNVIRIHDGVLDKIVEQSTSKAICDWLFDVPKEVKDVANKALHRTVKFNSILEHVASDVWLPKIEVDDIFVVIFQAIVQVASVAFTVNCSLTHKLSVLDNPKFAIDVLQLLVGPMTLTEGPFKKVFESIRKTIQMFSLVLKMNGGKYESNDNDYKSMLTNMKDMLGIMGDRELPEASLEDSLNFIEIGKSLWVSKDDLVRDANPYVKMVSLASDNSHYHSLSSENNCPGDWEPNPHSMLEVINILMDDSKVRHFAKVGTTHYRLNQKYIPDSILGMKGLLEYIDMADGTNVDLLRNVSCLTDCVYGERHGLGSDSSPLYDARLTVLENMHDTLGEILQKAAKYYSKSKNNKSVEEELNWPRLLLSIRVLEYLRVFPDKNARRTHDRVLHSIRTLARTSSEEEFSNCCLTILNEYSIQKSSLVPLMKRDFFSGFKILCLYHTKEVIGVSVLLLGLLSVVIAAFVIHGKKNKVSKLKKKKYESSDDSEAYFTGVGEGYESKWKGFVISDPACDVYRATDDFKLKNASPLKRDTDDKYRLQPGKYLLRNRNTGIITEKNVIANYESLLAQWAVTPYIERDSDGGFEQEQRFNRDLIGLPEDKRLMLKNLRYSQARDKIFNGGNGIDKTSVDKSVLESLKEHVSRLTSKINVLEQKAFESTNAEKVKITALPTVPPKVVIIDEKIKGGFEAGELFQSIASGLPTIEEVPDDAEIAVMSLGIIDEYIYEDEGISKVVGHESKTYNEIIKVPHRSVISIMDSRNQHVNHGLVTIKGVLTNKHAWQQLKNVDHFFVKAEGQPIQKVYYNSGDVLVSDGRDIVLIAFMPGGLNKEDFITSSKFGEGEIGESVVLCTRLGSQLRMHFGEVKSAPSKHSALGMAVEYTSSTSKGDCGGGVFSKSGKVYGIHFYGQTRTNLYVPFDAEFKKWFDSVSKNLDLSPSGVGGSA